MIASNTTAAKNDVAKQRESSRVESALAEVLHEALRRGFYGSAGVVLSVQDGHIQHIRLTVDRMIK